MIDFSDAQWENVKTNYRRWWKGELGRPILPCVFWGRDAGREMPKNPLLSFANCNDLRITPKQIVDRYDYELSGYEYVGDSFPLMQTMQFGPGIVAAFLGADLLNDSQTVWFRPKEVKPLNEMHFEYDADNIWLDRIREIFIEGMKRWQGNVVIGFPDLGGIMDILASFRQSDNLLYDLYDEPEQVKRLVNEIADLWHRFYLELCELLKGSQGYSDWSSIYYEKPSYMLQSDFSFMIGNDLFDEFVKPELEKTSARLSNAWYHLDGIGELKHLDSLLTVDTIKGIQWVPGEGEPRTRDWSEVYAKISKAKRKIQAYYDLDFHLDEILQVIERPDDLVKMQFGYSIDRKNEIVARLRKYGAE